MGYASGCGRRQESNRQPTPFQIFADYYQTGDSRDRALWRKYGRVTRGLAAVRWSPGPRSVIFGSDALADRTDGELAAENVDATYKASFPSRSGRGSGLQDSTTGC